MEFEVIARDGNTRIGEWHLEDQVVDTPAILWITTPSCHPPSFSTILYTNRESHPDHLCIKEGGSRCFPHNQSGPPGMTLPVSLIYPSCLPERFHKHAADWNTSHANDFCFIHEKSLDNIPRDSQVYIVANSSQLLRTPRRCIEILVALREKIGYQKLIYMPGVGDPSSLALLSYCTVDLFDSTSLILKTLENRYLTVDGEMDIPADLPCPCPACVDTPEVSHERLLLHNYYMAQTELKTIRQYIRMKKLRELVETRTMNSPLASCLPFLDREHYPFQEKRFPTMGNKITVSAQFLDRPDIKRFRQRIQERYVKPESSQILLLLPCSARKPYSLSKSHYLFQKIITCCPNPDVVHEVIVTSPLGLVPRELELTYPAGHYDIPVTGHWTQEEQIMLTETVQAFLKKNRYDHIIAHLPPEITSFLSLEATFTCTDHPTSSSSLHSLEDALSCLTATYPSSAPSNQRMKTIQSLLTFQFTKKGSRFFLQDCVIKGKYPYHKIFSGKEQLGMLVKERGAISLTLPGAQRIIQGGRYGVQIDDFFPHGSIFATGITDADDVIRVGDEVIVCHGTDVRAVGVAMMNSDEMIQSSRGEAVKVRHYKKESTPS